MTLLTRTVKPHHSTTIIYNYSDSVSVMSTKHIIQVEQHCSPLKVTSTFINAVFTVIKV